MSHRIYKDPSTNTFFIEGVVSGNVSEFDLVRNGEFFSIWHKGYDLWEIKDLHYTKFADGDHNEFDSADDADTYLQTALTYIPTGGSEGSSRDASVTVNIINLHTISYNLPNTPQQNSVKLFLNGLREKASSIIISGNTVNFENLELGIGDEVTIDYKY